MKKNQKNLEDNNRRDNICTIGGWQIRRKRENEMKKYSEK